MNKKTSSFYIDEDEYISRRNPIHAKRRNNILITDCLSNTKNKKIKIRCLSQKKIRLRLFGIEADAISGFLRI